jgi:hypothetical protein
MAFSYVIDPGTRRAIATGSGDSSYEEVRDLVERLVADPAYDPTAPLLVDCRTLEYLASYEDALRYRDLLAGLKDKFRGPIAVVVTGTARYGVTRIVASLLDLAGVHMSAFQTLDAAESWLAAPDAADAHDPHGAHGD